MVILLWEIVGFIPWWGECLGSWPALLGCAPEFLRHRWVMTGWLSSEMLIRYTLRTLNDSTRFLMEKFYELALAYAPAVNHIVLLICLIIAKCCGVLPLSF
ncbi:hypothetical protein GZ060_09975 [Klebsiella pneumoniae]|nr:hypothetical protein [Klebsiella pneumoniae]MBK0568350.1 hypothetical protein [Klebsiella pneumoniae]